MEQPEKNSSYVIEIKGVSSDGSGVADINGFVIFVPYTVTGDVVLAKIVKVHKKYAYAKALKIIEPSEYRKAADCAFFGKCGGCSFMHIEYSHQLEIKKEIIKDAMKRIGNTEHDVDEMIGADSDVRYRNKMIFPVGKDKNGEIVCGFFRERSHDIVALDDCMLGGKFNAEVIGVLKEYMKKYSVEPYDENTHSGTIRRVFTRIGRVSGEIMVVISANADLLVHDEELIKGLRNISSDIVSIILNINKKKTNFVLGEKNIVLFGKDRIHDTLCGIDYEISPHSFYQINHEQTQKLYSKALEYAKICRNDIVMDIYCGIGTISLAAAKMAEKVIGVEIVPSAIADAKNNALRNNIENAEFYCADAAELVPRLIDEGVLPTVVLLDPPRKGSDERTLKAIADAQPERIVYVSCNPSTLARDIKFLACQGYEAEKICGVDMFPQTSHVETIVLLQRRDT